MIRGSKLKDAREQDRQLVDYLRLALGLAPLYQQARDKIDLRHVPLPEEEGWFQYAKRTADDTRLPESNSYSRGDFNSRSVRHARVKALRFKSTT